MDYCSGLIEDFTPLAGDRAFGEDEAIVGGFGRFRGEAVCVLGQEKGATTDAAIRHNFGMARPEGYRKAVRLMELADRFELPVLSFVDTAGAYPGIEAEERGQAEAIARSTEMQLALGVPNVSVIIGEGGSGGAIAIATANKVLMLEHAIYSVISPEGAASILWRDSGARPGRSHQHEDHGPGSAAPRRHRRHRRGAHRRRPSGAASRHQGHGRRDPERLEGPRQHGPGGSSGTTARRSSWPSGASFSASRGEGAPDGSPKWNPL